MLSRRQSVLKGLKLIGLQFSLLVIISVLFALLDLDRTIASVFYDSTDKWFMGRHPIWRVLYRYGTLPGMLLALACLIGWLISFFNRRLESWRPYLLLVVLTTVIAGGLLVNTVFKQYWGRPRPNQITEFGGHYLYRHVFPPGVPGKGASFPSGHSAMGFTFITLVFLHRRSTKIAYAGLGTGLLLGGALSAARLVKGAHFATDVFWSLGIVLMTATALYYCLQKIPARSTPAPKTALNPGRKAGLILGVILAVLLITGAFMTRRPFYKTQQFHFPIGAAISRVQIHINATPEKLTVRDADIQSGRILVHAHGFGWAYVDYDLHADFVTRENTLDVCLNAEARSYFAELDHSIEVILPAGRKDEITVEVIPSKVKVDCDRPLP